MPASNSLDKRQVALVTTTIYVPKCLTAYVENVERHGHADRLSVIVVGDRKTPAETAEYLRELSRQTAAKITYMDVEMQKKMLRRWPALDVVLRYNCIQRRNVGYLQAALDGAEVIIAADDDNFVTDEDYLSPHMRVGKPLKVPVVSHASGWWNVCQRLLCDPPRRFYHRGYPKSRQDFGPNVPQIETAQVKPVVNAGLWLRNPDVDATANIEEPIRVVDMAPIAGDRTCALAPGTWCPFNSQNTAFDIATLPAMYLVVMLDYMRGYRVGRLDDIWMSYFIRAIADQLGDVVLYGPPLVAQHRNPHNYVRDMAEELGGYILTEKIVEYLRSFRTGERNYLGAYLDLTYHLKDAAEGDKELEAPEREYLRQMVLGMAAWQGAVADIWGASRR
jgi:hypothetical protein